MNLGNRNSLHNQNLYKEFMEYVAELEKGNQGAITIVRNFFDSDKEFIDIMINTHKVRKKAKNNLEKKKNLEIQKESNKKKHAQIKRKFDDAAKRIADRNLLYFMEIKDSEKFRYAMHDSVPAKAFALFLNFLKTQKKVKISDKVDNIVEDNEIEITTIITKKSPEAKWERQNFREIDGEILTPYTTPEEVASKETREEKRNNKQEGSNQIELLKKELHKEQVPVKVDKYGQTYFDFFGDEYIENSETKKMNLKKK